MDPTVSNDAKKQQPQKPNRSEPDEGDTRTTEEPDIDIETTSEAVSESTTEEEELEPYVANSAVIEVSPWKQVRSWFMSH